METWVSDVTLAQLATNSQYDDERVGAVGDAVGVTACRREETRRRGSRARERLRAAICQELAVSRGKLGS
jgi:hypothetical protein